MSAGGPKGEATVITPTAAERTVARRAAESRATVPHLELSVPRARPGEQATGSLLKACAVALTSHPRANAAYRDGHFELYPRVNIGVVLALEDTYLIPTVLDADGKTVGELADEVDQLRAGAESGQLTPPMFSGATFTVWNAGDHGIAQASLPVVPPQAGLLTVGTHTLTLTCDHRILYGGAAARFLNDLSRQLEAEAG